MNKALNETRILILVESPTKCDTIERYLSGLPAKYSVKATYGHVMDIPSKSGAVDPDNNFSMNYQPIAKNQKHIDTIISAAAKSDEIILATDPDREGEAISANIATLMEKAGVLKGKKVGRAVFHQITKGAIREAIANLRDVSVDMVEAQKARRALDHLVGFNLSPLLWKKIRYGLSAGRVQSPALRLIVEREAEIEAFKSQEYWTMWAHMQEQQINFAAKLTHYDKQKVEQFTLNSEELAGDALAKIKAAAKDILVVKDITKQQRKRNPAAPFRTSTLQQEAARKLGFSSAKTMQVAQKLYEGIDVGNGGKEGLITYMRTDSAHLSEEGVAALRKVIGEDYGAAMLPASANNYANKVKSAQEAHEAIRPNDPRLRPDKIKSKLSPEQYRLYNLIWQRAVASQMRHADLEQTRIELDAGGVATFRASGTVVVEPGFLRVYEEGSDSTNAEDDKGKRMPALKVGQEIGVERWENKQHFTEPPPRFSEASLIKVLEEYGIGRPSTYASIINTLKTRRYVEYEQKRFTPTDVGKVVGNFLASYFTKYVDYGFTADLEDKLDSVATGKETMLHLLGDFWQPFKDKIGEIDKSVSKTDVTHEKLDEACPDCGGTLSIRLGKVGRFVGCDSYPDCKYTRNMDGEVEEPAEEVGRKCPECKDGDLEYKQGRYGKFIGCSNYPKCKNIESLVKPESTDVTCPKCTKGTLMKRKNRRGQFFYACDAYPKCKYAISNEPLVKACPKCKWPILMRKETKRYGVQEVCPDKECGYKSEPTAEDKK